MMAGAGEGAGDGGAVKCACGAGLSHLALFCHRCGALRPPGQLTPFERMGLRPGFGIDPAELEKRYLALQVRLHPDRLVSRPQAERDLAPAHASALNEAFRILSSPFSRGMALLEILAGPDGKGGDTAGEDILAAALEQREELETARNDPGRLAQLEDRAGQVREDIIRDIGNAFDAGAYDRARQALLRLRYQDRYLEAIHSAAEQERDNADP